MTSSKVNHLNRAVDWIYRNSQGETMQSIAESARVSQQLVKMTIRRMADRPRVQVAVSMRSDYEKSMRGLSEARV